VAINPHNRGPLRTLTIFVLLIVGLYGLLGAVSTWGTAQRTPKLGLDLQGGTQLILTPRVDGNKPINPGQVVKAVDIIRARVDGSGVAEAEVTTQGNNIVVSLPGKVDAATTQSLQKSSQLQMRAVLIAAPAVSAPVPTPTGPTPLKPTTPATSKPVATGGATTAPKSGFPPALVAAPTVPAPTAAPTTAAPTTAAPTTGAKPKDASDLAWVTPELEKQLAALNCADKKQVAASGRCVAVSRGDTEDLGVSVDGYDDDVLELAASSEVRDERRKADGLAGEGSVAKEPESEASGDDGEVMEDVAD